MACSLSRQNVSVVQPSGQIFSCYDVGSANPPQFLLWKKEKAQAEATRRTHTRDRLVKLPTHKSQTMKAYLQGQRHWLQEERLTGKLPRDLGS